MKRLILVVSLLIVSVATVTIPSVAQSAQSKPVAVGQPAPGFTLIDHQGRKVTLSESRGSAVVLVFYRGFW